MNILSRTDNTASTAILIGCEIDPKHFATAERRIEDSKPTLFAAFASEEL